MEWWCEQKSVSEGLRCKRRQRGVLVRESAATACYAGARDLAKEHGMSRPPRMGAPLVLAIVLATSGCGTALTQTKLRGGAWLATAVAGDVAISYGVYRVRIADETNHEDDGIKLLTSSLLTFGIDLAGLLLYGTTLRGL